MAQVLLSAGEKTFIIHGIKDNFRNDGRSNIDYRNIEVETDVVSNCNGSAHVRLAKTDILVGIKAELDSPNPGTPMQGKIQIFVDCTANADPEFEGRGGEDIALEISSILMRAYSSPKCVDLKSLCVIPGQQVWVLYVDVVVLECGGSLLDATSIAVKAALYDTKIPYVNIKTDGGEPEIEVSDDPYDVVRLDVTNVPCIVTLSRVGHQFIVDATQQEEACSISRLAMAVTEGGSVTSVLKLEAGSLHLESILDILELGKEIAVTLNKELIEKLKNESSVKEERRGFLL